MLFHAVLAGSFAIGADLHAHSFDCITTAADFQTALDQAGDDGIYSGEDSYIQLAAAIYTTGSGPFHYTSTASTGLLGIIGGATASCFGYTEDPTLVMLDGHHTTQVLNIRTNNYVFLRLMTIQNGVSTTAGGGLAVNQGNAGGEVQISDNIIRNNHTSTNGGGIAAYTSYSYISLPELYLTANVIYGNSADGNYGAALLQGDNTLTEILNNTVYDNTTTAVGGAGGLAWAGVNGTGRIYNNIFWNNTTYGLYLVGNGAIVDYNDYGAIGGNAPDASSTGNLTMIAPEFVNAGSGNFHLASKSPLLGIGLAFCGAGEDIEAAPFPATGKADLGAYSDTIFIDSVDGDAPVCPPNP
ncbi:MAG TPA: right-handed parallel beta-helix repeat-containing protein [Rudaea sp.]